MGVSVVTLALARKSAKKSIDVAVAKAIQDCMKYTDDKFDEIASFKITIVSELPPLSEADSHTIYFVPKTSPSGEADSYYEYMSIDKKWEIIGSTELDLSNYWTIDEVKTYIESKQYTLPIATKSILGGVKIDEKTIQINNEGIISVVETYIQTVSKEVLDTNFIRITENEIKQLFN